MGDAIWAIPLGFVVGAYGTLIGAGGGFVLMPVLLLLFPGQSPELLTSISLAVVFFNAASGSWAYARLKRIDYRSGLLFSAATVPGAIFGALTTGYLPRRLFDGVFGVILIAACAVLMLRPAGARKHEGRTSIFTVVRTLVEADGTKHSITYDARTGVIISLVVGYLSSLLGIGGGIIHVPVLVHLLGFPVHIATATSHFVLAVMALSGTAVHIASGVFTQGVRLTLLLGIGVILGAQVGARWSGRVQGSWILRGLALALGLVGVRILFMAL
jgi:uncharacterized membrane protein YfcA